MSGKSGGNFFESLGVTSGGNFFEDLLSVGLNIGTGGVVGYSADGGLGAGAIPNYLKNVGNETMRGVKNVTGAKAAEDANKMARQQMEEQRAMAEQERANQQQRTAKDQMRQSQLAGAARGGQSGANRSSGMGAINIGDDERDFLGL
jgi:hypothetical protein